jgi:hypothetical protein
MGKFIWSISVLLPTAIAISQIADQGSMSLVLQISTLIMFFLYGTLIQLSS